MKKKLFSLLAALTLALALAVPGLAAGTLVRDEYGQYMESTRAEMEAEAQRISANYGCNVYWLTVADIGRETARDYAELYYLNNGLGYGPQQSGILFLIALESRDYVTITYGEGITAFTDFRIGQMEDEIVPLLSNGEYRDAAKTYLKLCEETLAFYAEKGEPWDSDNDPGNALVVLLIKLGAVILVPLLAAAGVCAVFRGQMKTAVSKTQANDYIPQGGFDLRRRVDQFTHTTETRVYDPPQKTASRGSSVSSRGFGGSRGGKF